MYQGKLHKALLGLALVSALLLQSCGGGGGGAPADGGAVALPPTANSAPVVDTGVVQSVLTGSTVTLDASRSVDADGDSLSYSWVLSGRPAGSTTALQRANTAQPTFAADVPGSYTLTLVVTDSKGSSTSTTVTVVVSSTNAPPVANPGTAQNVVVGNTVTLDGSASSDANGDALTYRWTLSTRPAGSNATLSSPSNPRPTFVADQPGTYTASLIVNDGQVDSIGANVNIVASSTNAAPVANAGTAQSVAVGSLVVLDGSASSDANGDPLTYSWTLTSQPAGSAAALTAATSARPAFTADQPGSYVVSLVVNDGRVASTPATTVVTANSGNVAPVANAGPAQNVLTGSVVTLDGTASSDANGDALSYNWALTSRPTGSAAALGASTSARPTFTADRDGAYVATLSVSDGTLTSALSTVVINAAASNVAPVANAGTAQSVTAGQTVTLDGTASSDANGDTLTYNWTLSSRPAGSTAQLSSATAPRPTFTADVTGSYVASLTVSDGRLSSSAAAVTIAVNPAGTPQILIDKPEPLAGPVRLSLSSTVSGAVYWYLDLNPLGPGATTLGNFYDFNVVSITPGAHLITARVQTGPSTFYEVRRTVQIETTTLQVSYRFAYPGSLTSVDPLVQGDPVISFYATPRSVYGTSVYVTQILVAFDGVAAGSMTRCNNTSCRGDFVYSVDAVALGSGIHSMALTMTDSLGNVETFTLSFTINNRAALTVTSPASGASVSGTLQIAGTATVDRPVPVNVEVFIAPAAGTYSLPIATMTGPSFLVNYPLTGLPAGSYKIRVTARTDDQPRADTKEVFFQVTTGP